MALTATEREQLIDFLMSWYLK
ncbi:hypothetical protein [uncultured Shewanella sp.]|nr:hypothetical protein [uncultured Shewanella sp.]